MTLEIEVPSSKSMTQRALVIAALAAEQTVIERPLECDDSRYLRRALGQMGAAVDWSAHEARVTPAPLRGASVHCGNAGTAVRFGACLSLICEGPLCIDGDEHMRRRPIGPLAKSLEALGVRVRYLEREGCAPIELERVGETPPGVAVDTSLSSQYASGLMMVAPRLPDGLTITLTGELVSQPYLHMTAAMMRRQGAAVEWDDPREIIIPEGCYQGGAVAVEPDWSAAAFVLAAARITGADVAPAHVPTQSLQGDAAIVDLLAGLDTAEQNDIDLADAPDLIAPLVAACVFARRPTRIRGAAHTRVKECDRVAVLCRGLRQLGVDAREHPDGLDLAPIGAIPSERVVIDPESDHRMAMAFGVLSLLIRGIEVTDPGCVSKSFPSFWDALGTIRQHIG